ncbi:hypothetical protein BGZ73_001257 [Actinomortierella ambigua]|nr:hypothetical protein BGZ73_001257 [Actinomortierella ambigua]
MAFTDSTATPDEQRPILTGAAHRQDSNAANSLLSAASRSDDSYKTIVPSATSSPGSPAGGSGSTGSSSADESSDSSSDEADFLPKPNSTSARRNKNSNSTCAFDMQRMRQVAYVIAQLGLVLFFGTLTSVIVKAPWAYPYSWHPILMGLFGLLATEAVLVLQPKELARHKRRLKTVHAVAHGATLLLVIFGFWAVYANKSMQNKIHFKSYHAWWGMAAMVMIFVQVIFGILVGYYPRLFRNYGQPRVMRLHRVLGYVSIALLWVTLWLGTITNWMNRNFDKPWIMNLATTMVAIGMVAGITPDRLFKRSGYRTYASKSETGVEHLEALLKDVTPGSSTATSAAKESTTTATTTTSRKASSSQQEGVDMIMETLNRVSDRVASARSSSSVSSAGSFFGARNVARIPQRHLASHNLHIHASMNNTILTLTDATGVPIANTSAGAAGLKKSQRSGPEAGYQAMCKMIEKVQEKNVHITSLHVLLKGIGPGRDAAFKAITTKTSWDIKRISDTTPIPFNGCRPPKPRRL